MNKLELLKLLAKLDAALTSPTILHIYGSAVVILLDAPERTSMDMDVAGIYSSANQAELERVASSIQFPLNPDAHYDGAHIEWVGPLRLCLPPPTTNDLILWQGGKLTIKTGSIEDLVASKLIRYDLTDQADIQFLFFQSKFTLESVRESVSRLPTTFRGDALVLENLENLARDIALWKDEK
jgi:hypothetical protein